MEAQVTPDAARPRARVNNSAARVSARKEALWGRDPEVAPLTADLGWENEPDRPLPNARDLWT
jgi:hypothetical protein